MDHFLSSEVQKLTPQMAQALTYKAQSPQRITEHKLYEDCCRHIRATAAQGRSSCIFKVPAYMLGLPLYRVNLMRDSLAYRFTQEGWKAMVRDKDLIMIDWKEPGGKKAKAGAAKSKAKQQRK